MTGRRSSHAHSAARRRPTVYTKIFVVLTLVCFIGAILVFLAGSSLALRPQLLTRVLAVALCSIPALYVAMVFPRRPVCIVPGPTPHCLRCGYPADVPAPRCPECGVVRTDRTVVLGTPRFLPSDTAKALWGMILFGAIVIAGMVVWAMRY